MKKTILAALLLCQTLVSLAQDLSWHTPSFVNGVCQRDSAGIYHRLPAALKDEVRPIVWNLSLNTAGEYIHFRSSARSFIIKYGLSGKSLAMPHMPSTGVSGLDLYAVDKNGAWNWAPPGYRFGDTCVYSYRDIYVASGQMADFYLYLPLYNAVKWLSIGVTQNEQLEFIDERKEKPVVAYGTSIMEGAVASRPGFAWTNILHRNLGREIINLGFSGNGKFEKPIFDLMAKVDAAVYIFDCMPNLTREAVSAPDEVENRIRYGLTKLRSAHPGVPVLLAEYPDGDIPFYTDTALLNNRHNASMLIASVYRKLQAEGISNLYLLTEKEIGFDINCLTETTHPNDIGMMKYAVAYERKLREILHEPAGAYPTQRPVEQYRDGFDWNKRHEQIIRNIIKTNPRVMLFGNSIIHYWGGEPASETTAARGAASWRRYMAPLGIQNAGFGNDRIENVLWRVYHDELDRFEGDKIVINIGTNNLAVNTDEEIVEGLAFLAQQVKNRKPAARIYIGAILPRKNKLERLAGLNRLIQKMAEAKGYSFFDFTEKFMTGEDLNFALFMPDGLHPNEKGYDVLGRCFKNLH
ncbi:SGNH/GDSL hydrolase family protein [Pararcticibacter amylolyticus]|uniref:Acetylhydrolase n=1 Tax=Pararcticibacter amylolyticus TaxID=2173175 RepID=A0A2U2P9V3_9SPHI|nr:SGNH/GDSL hydrolase family protein [Pararcticibacter amylolyticus]PWG78178.1 acetylhydrolase [Pararcticibacter amylolyticus]